MVVGIALTKVVNQLEDLRIAEGIAILFGFSTLVTSQVVCKGFQVSTL